MCTSDDSDGASVMDRSDSNELLDGLLTHVEIEARIVDELERIRQIESRLRDEPEADRRFGEAERFFLTSEAPTSKGESATDTEPILRLMRAAQTAMMRHPAASSLIFNALVDEGRRYVETSEGQARADALAADPVMNDLRRLWEATSLNVIGDDGDESEPGVPAGWIDLILDTAASADVDLLVAEMSPDPRP